MRVGILGAAEARFENGPADLGTRKQRALLAALVLNGGRAVAPDTLVDLIWGDHPPAAVTPTLHGYVAKLRRALEPDRPPRAPSQVLVLTDQGYELRLDEDALDSVRFERAVREAHAALGGAPLAGPVRLDGAEQVIASLERVLSLWRGTPYAELEDAPAAEAERARLEELRAVALEDRAVAALALGRHAMVSGELEVLTATYPLRERLWGLRAVALAGSGRQADALEVLREVRELLAEELGLEPGPELRELQGAILRQEPSLSHAPPERTAPASAAADVTRFAWPLVGRDDQLAALVGLLEQSADATVFAAVTGEPGIGKSRLCGELAEIARGLGVKVLVGRCSQDDGAPPLYPWASVLRELGQELPSEIGGDGGDDNVQRFRAWEQIVRAVLDAAGERPLLVVLDDLHWADVSTLRVLRLLAETADSARLLVVCTWRHEPAPSGQLAVVADMLARRHALRLHLEGLSADEAAEVVTSVAATAPTTAEADALRSRTEGNPFFLVEYARLAGDSGDLTALLAEDNPPAAVSDVLGRRLAALPEATLGALRHACVFGRQFDVPTLAEVMGEDEDTLIDALEPALSAGLVREFGVDRFRFAHALIRDTSYAGISQSRRGRLHARTAEVLGSASGRESEVARHWLAAGPRHVHEAWRAAVVAAEKARQVYGYDEAVELLLRAATAAGEDPAATSEDEYDVLLRLGLALQLAGNWVDLRDVVHRLITLATELEDLDRLVTAAVLPSQGALWQSAHHGTVDDVIVAALRRALDLLPPGDDERRCRVMMALSGELYYSAAPPEREALAESALAMAARLGDQTLLLNCCLSASISTWRAANAQSRLELAEQALELAEQLGDGIAASTAMTLRAVSLHELGRIADMDEAIEVAWHQARKERHAYGQLVLAGLGVTWAAVRGEEAERQRLLDVMLALGDQMNLAQMEDAVTGAIVSQLIWERRYDEMAAALAASQEASILPFTTIRATVLARGGHHDEAAGIFDDDVLSEVSDDWFAPLAWALAGELALRFRRPVLGAEAYGLLATVPGRPASAGSGAVLGPVDAFLAMAAASVGDAELATQHADRAADLCEQWRAAPAGVWFAEMRREFGF